VTVFVNAIMYYKVANATNAVANVDDYSGSARLLAATTLRNVLGTLNLGDILSQREMIAKEMQVCCKIKSMVAIFLPSPPWITPQKPGA
jgi:erythrocyte band 7 integral membrane protein